MSITPEILIADGFKPNAHANAYNRGDYCVVFGDVDLLVSKYNNPLSRCTEWTCRLSLNMPAGKLRDVLALMTYE